MVLRPAVVRREAGAAGGAPLLAEAADPAAAALVLLLVDVEDDGLDGRGVAGLVLLGRRVGEHGAVAGGDERDPEPGGVGDADRDLALAAGALDARDLRDGVTFSEGALHDRSRRLVAHVLVGAVGAVLDAVAAAVVGDELLVGADEVRLGARAGGVVASRSGGGDSVFEGSDGKSFGRRRKAADGDEEKNRECEEDTRHFLFCFRKKKIIKKKKGRGKSKE